VLDAVVFHGANIHGQLPHLPGALFNLLAADLAAWHLSSRLTSCWALAQGSPLWPPQSLLLSHNKPRTQPLHQRLQWQRGATQIQNCSLSPSPLLPMTMMTAVLLMMGSQGLTDQRQRGPRRWGISECYLSSCGRRCTAVTAPQQQRRRQRCHGCCSGSAWRSGTSRRLLRQVCISRCRQLRLPADAVDRRLKSMSSAVCTCCHARRCFSGALCTS